MDEWTSLRWGISTTQEALLRNAESIRERLQAGNMDEEDARALWQALTVIESAIKDLSSD